jgi:hypothetical protein
MNQNRRTRKTAERGSGRGTGTSPRGTIDQPLATIIEYTDRKAPRNRYPERIVSPLRSGPCCFSDMEEVGKPEEEGRWVFQYKRCRNCGFAVRVILREIPDAALAAELRRTLANSFVRNVPD